MSKHVTVSLPFAPARHLISADRYHRKVATTRMMHVSFELSDTSGSSDVFWSNTRRFFFEQVVSANRATLHVQLTSSERDTEADVNALCLCPLMKSGNSVLLRLRFSESVKTMSWPHSEHLINILREVT